MPSHPKRAKSVPAEAQWNQEEKEWQYWQATAPFNVQLRAAGELRCWRENGDLASISQLDDEGARHGTCIRFHPDGSIASQGEWRHGKRSGHFVFVRCEHDSPESYPEPYEGTWRVELDVTHHRSESNKRYFLKDGIECTKTGRPLATAFDLDVLFDASSPKDFVAMDGEHIMEALSAHDSAPTKAMLEMLGIGALPEALGLDELFGYQDRHINPWLRLLNRTGNRFFHGTCKGSTLISPARFSSSDSQNDPLFIRNAMEWFLGQRDLNLYERLAQAFSGAFSIGKLDDCNSWYVGIFDHWDQRIGTICHSPEVYLWDHDNYGFSHLDFGSVDDFFWHLSINEAHSQDRLSEDAKQRASAKQSVAVEQDAWANTLFFYWRAYWLIQLMDGNSGNGRLLDLGDAFHKKLNTPIDQQLHQDLLKTGKTLPPTALYVMWRYFWFGHETRLREALDAFRDAPARLTRDCAALIQELLDGRDQLPWLPEVRTLREQLIALELDPDRPSQPRLGSGAMAG